MKRVILVLEKVALGIEDESILRDHSLIDWMVQRSEVSVLEPQPATTTPELALFGLDPQDFRIEPGPIMAAAFKIDPPQRSVCFQLSLVSLGLSGEIDRQPPTPTPSEESVVREAFEKLESSKLVPCFGSGLDHVLVWLDGSLDLGTSEPGSQPYQASLPEGDGEVILRKFIDDSVNILGETEFNRVRQGEGLAPLNMLWPWGQGQAASFPNLSLQRGEVTRVESSSLRLRGLSRLFGLKHCSIADFGKRLAPNLDHFKRVAESENLVIVRLECFEDALTLGRGDHARRQIEDLAEKVLDPILQRRDIKLTLIATGHNAGLACHYNPDGPVNNALPFDERIFDEKRAAKLELWEAVSRGLRP